MGGSNVDVRFYRFKVICIIFKCNLVRVILNYNKLECKWSKLESGNIFCVIILK